MYGRTKGVAGSTVVSEPPFAKIHAQVGRFRGLLGFGAENVYNAVSFEIGSDLISLAGLKVSSN